jgi:hypothetical protein
MHKKGITEEVAKKRSRKNVKVQVGGFGSGKGCMVAPISLFWGMGAVRTQARQSLPCAFPTLMGHPN